MRQRSRIKWFLDVDGVINAANPAWSEKPSRVHVYASSVKREYRIRWAPSLLRFIRDVHQRGDVDIVWSTTWVNDVRELERALRLPQFDVAFTFDPADSIRVSNLKVNATWEAVSSGHPVIWTDDEVVTHDLVTGIPEDESWSTELFIRPASRHGLSRVDCSRIFRFIQHHTSDH